MIYLQYIQFEILLTKLSIINDGDPALIGIIWVNVISQNIRIVI